MLYGRFGNTSGRPFLEGRLILPRLEIAGHVSFLVDTGADESFLHPADGLLLGVPYANLQDEHESVAIGGSVRTCIEPAVIAFSEAGVAVHAYHVRIGIPEPTQDTMGLPSLLGRDVLDHWRMVYEPSNRLLAFEVLSADATFPLK